MRLITFSWAVILVAVAAAAVHWLGLAGWMAAAVLAGSVAMHVAGNAIGTRLREATDRDLARHRGGFRSQPIPPAQAGHLERSTRPGRLLPVSAGIGAAAGGCIGALLLHGLAGASPPGAVLGGLSSAVIGGLFSFMLASFCDILRTSIREAIRAEGGPMAADRKPPVGRQPPARMD
jgi:hypothetical protein